MMKMYTQYDFILYLNSKFKFFGGDKIDSLEYVTQFLLRLDLFQMKNMTSERKKTSDVKKYHSSTKPFAAKYISFKTMYSIHNF